MVPQVAQLLGDPGAPLAVDGVLDDPDPGPPAAGATGSGAGAADPVEQLHHRVAGGGCSGTREEQVDHVPGGVDVVGRVHRPRPSRLGEHAREVGVDAARPHDLRLVPLVGVGEVGEVHRGLDDHVAHVARAHVVEQEVLGVRGAPRASARALAPAGEAVHRRGHPVPGTIEPAAQMLAQVAPGAALLVLPGRSDDLHADPAVAGGDQRLRHCPVLEGPGRDPDGAVGRHRRAQGVAAAAPDAPDRQQHPVADGTPLLLAAVGVAEVAPRRHRVAAPWPGRHLAGPVRHRVRVAMAGGPGGFGGRGRRSGRHDERRHAHQDRDDHGGHESGRGEHGHRPTPGCDERSSPRRADGSQAWIRPDFG